MPRRRAWAAAPRLALLRTAGWAAPSRALRPAALDRAPSLQGQHRKKAHSRMEPRPTGGRRTAARCANQPASGKGAWQAATEPISPLGGGYTPSGGGLLGLVSAPIAGDRSRNAQAARYSRGGREWGRRVKRRKFFPSPRPACCVLDEQRPWNGCPGCTVICTQTWLARVSEDPLHRPLTPARAVATKACWDLPRATARSPPRRL